MNANDVKTIARFAGAMTAVGVSATIYVKIARDERAKRVEIEKNLHLDLKAIRLASDELSKRIAAGAYDGQLTRMFDDLNTEIAFQKIAIRNEI